jgi:phosphonate metabolism protein PhnP
LHYGIPIEIDQWLAEGHDVLINGSRGHLPQARARYPDLLVVLLCVDQAVLRQRLLARGRESAEEIEARLGRNAQFADELLATAPDKRPCGDPAGQLRCAGADGQPPVATYRPGARMRLTLLGTGDARQVPVYGCQCQACQAAHADPRLRRRPCSALVELGDQRWLIDSGLPDLTERFPPRSLSGIFQTHYHADHAQGLLHLRWGQGLVIPVHGPVDPARAVGSVQAPWDSRFQPAVRGIRNPPFGELQVTALPLLHSKPTLGYLLQGGGRRVAYLTDTVGCRMTPPRVCSDRHWMC